MIDVAVHVAVVDQPEDVDGATSGRARHDLAPRGRCPCASGCDGRTHQLGTLVEDPTGLHRVVADFRVAHVAIGRHPHGGAVRCEQAPRIGCEQSVPDRGFCEVDGVAVVAGAPTEAVEDAQQVRVDMENLLGEGALSLGRRR